uniref:Uncharacterized protein n=1 Tax=Ditylenchus dipsaci TaxID=166011 RepID=A0A915DJ62_9BILA
MYSLLYETDDSTAVNLSAYGKLRQAASYSGGQMLEILSCQSYSSIPAEEAKSSGYSQQNLNACSILNDGSCQVNGSCQSSIVSKL